MNDIAQSFGRLILIWDMVALIVIITRFIMTINKEFVATN